MKKWFRRVAAFGLALCLTVGLCACGTKNNTMVNAALAKEGVYRLTEFDMPELGGDGINIYGTAHNNGMLYFIVEVYHWNEESNGNMDVRVISMKEDGSDAQVHALEFPEKKTDTSGGQQGGTIEPMPREPQTMDTKDVIDTGTVSQRWEYDSYQYYTIAPDGNIYAIRNHRLEDYSDPENAISEQNYFVVCWDANGSMLSEKELEGISSEEEYVYINNMTVAKDGTVHVLLSGENVYKMTVDAQGNVSERKAVSEEISKMLMNLNSLTAREDGTFLAMYYDEDWTKQYIATYDPITDTIGEPVALPTSMSMNGYSTLNTGVSSDLIFSNNKGVYTYNIGDADSTQKMSFVNSDMNISNMNGLMELDENSFVAVFYENWEDMKIGLFTHVPPEEIPDKAVLVLAGNYVDSELKQRVVEYNRTSEQYRIVLKEYDSYNTYEDYQAGYTQLNNDIIAGNMPDILITDNLPVENYAAKGLLADIGQLIENDEELSKVEFVQNVFDAYSVDGKLYYIIPNFNVMTMVAKTSLVGDRTTWTMEDAQNLVKSMPEGTVLLGETTRDSFFSTMMDFCGSDFVDVSTGKCNFNSPNFINMMEYAKTLPVELNEEYYGEDYWMNYQNQYRDNRTILCRLSIGNISNLNYTINGRIGEDVSYVGFPTESGQGSYVNAFNSYAISAKSPNLEGAWDFMRYYLTEEYQSTLEWGLPIHKEYFLKNAQKALEKPYYLDENGNKVEYDETYWVNNESIVLPQMTQAQIDKVVNFIFSIQKGYYSNNEIMTIINEEIEPFYSGQKSAQEVAQVIQNRAQLFVDVNR